jgi:polyvinyl alcohol dehydrogenase (cytochrome)
MITSSPVVYNGIVYIGVSGGPEEDFLTTDTAVYPCCSFQGSVVALNQSNGPILWKTYDMPCSPSNPGGYSGGTIWGSTPVVDPRLGSIYVTSGNNFSIPQDVATCLAAAQAMDEADTVCNASTTRDKTISIRS